MVDEATGLISEIQQIRVQYVAEVGDGRRVWPLSIKERVARLEAMGIPRKSIAQKTGVPYDTINLWSYRLRREKAMTSGSFHEVAVTGAALPAILKSVTVTVPKIEMQQLVKPSTIRLQTPEGFVIEGLDAAGVLAMIRAISGGGQHAS
jgi:hypothetical protein